MFRKQAVKIIFAIILVIFLSGCPNGPSRRVVVEPHPEQGFNLFVVPKGAWVGNHKTESAGMYIGEDLVEQLVWKIWQLEKKASFKRKRLQ